MSDERERTIGLFGRRDFLRVGAAATAGAVWACRDSTAEQERKTAAASKTPSQCPDDASQALCPDADTEDERMTDHFKEIDGQHAVLDLPESDRQPEVRLSILWIEFGRSLGAGLEVDPDVVKVGREKMRGLVVHKWNESAYRAAWQRMAEHVSQGGGTKVDVGMFDGAFKQENLGNESADDKLNDPDDEFTERVGDGLWMAFGIGVREISTVLKIDYDAVIRRARTLSRPYLRKNVGKCNGSYGTWPHAKVQVCARFAGRRAAKHALKDHPSSDVIDADDFEFAFYQVSHAFKTVCTSPSKSIKPLSLACG